MTDRIDLPDVQRVSDDGGSHIEPPLAAESSPSEKIAWHAAVCALDSGVPISVYDVDGEFSINAGSSSHSQMPFDMAWVYLNGVRTGAQWAADQRSELGPVVTLAEDRS